MSTGKERLVAFVRAIEQGQRQAAMREHYAVDVMIFENRRLVRAGLAACLAHEAETSKGLVAPVSARALAFAYDEPSGVSFVEWLLRFTSGEGRPMRLEEVAVQRWEQGKIAQERLYYEGLVDEGD